MYLNFARIRRIFTENDRYILLLHYILRIAKVVLNIRIKRQYNAVFCLIIPHAKIFASNILWVTLRMESQFRKRCPPKSLITNENDFFWKSELVKRRVGKCCFSNQIHGIRQLYLPQGISFAEAKIIYNEQFTIRTKFHFREICALPECIRTQDLA